MAFRPHRWRWPGSRGRPGVANIIVGARTEAQLKDNLAAASLVLTAEQRKLLDDVSLQPLLYPYWHQCNTVADDGWAPQRASWRCMRPHVGAEPAKPPAIVICQGGHHHDIARPTSPSIRSACGTR